MTGTASTSSSSSTATEEAMVARRHTISTSIGLLILRLGIGGYLLTHGFGKLQLLLGGNFEIVGDPIGIGSGASSVLIVFAEFFCALLVMVGLATRMAAVPVVIAMAVAAFVIHGADPWTSSAAVEITPEGEYRLGFSKQPALMFLIPFLALIFTGPGRLSLDALIWPRLRERRAGRTRRSEQ